MDWWELADILLLAVLVGITGYYARVTARTYQEIRDENRRKQRPHLRFFAQGFPSHDSIQERQEKPAAGDLALRNAGPGVATDLRLQVIPQAISVRVEILGRVGGVHGHATAAYGSGNDVRVAMLLPGEAVRFSLTAEPGTLFLGRNFRAVLDFQDGLGGKRQMEIKPQHDSTYNAFVVRYTKLPYVT